MEKAEKRAHAVKDTARVTVRKVANEGEAVLVEWWEGKNILRASIPRAYLGEDGTVEEAVLEAGIPYGLEWSEIPIKAIKPADLQNVLRMRGIWTKEDLGRNLQAASLGLLELAGPTLIALLEFANKEDK